MKGQRTPLYHVFFSFLSQELKGFYESLGDETCSVLQGARKPSVQVKMEEFNKVEGEELNIEYVTWAQLDEADENLNLFGIETRSEPSERLNTEEGNTLTFLFPGKGIYAPSDDSYITTPAMWLEE